MGNIVMIDDAHLLLAPKPLGISLIIPVKDPEPYLPNLLRLINDTLKDIPNEILIQREKGLTNAVIKGVENSKFPLIAVMDADGSHIPFYLSKMFEEFQLNPSIDLVIGSKTGSQGIDESPFYRKVISKMFRSLARFMLKLDVEDPMSGFVMGKKKWFLKLEPSNDYKFVLQLLCMNPPWVVELPIYFRERQKGSSKATLNTGIQTLRLIYKLWRKKL